MLVQIYVCPIRWKQQNVIVLLQSTAWHVVDRFICLQGVSSIVWYSVKTVLQTSNTLMIELYILLRSCDQHLYTNVAGSLSLFSVQVHKLFFQSNLMGQFDHWTRNIEIDTNDQALSNQTDRNFASKISGKSMTFGSQTCEGS